MGHKIKVVVDNRTAYLSGDYNYGKLIPYWSYSVENYQHILKARPHFRQCRICHKYPSKHKNRGHSYVPVWDGRIKFLKRNALPAGLFWATYREIENEYKLKFKIYDESDGVQKRKTKKWLESEGKYSFQNDCVDKMYAAAKVGTGGLILNATGSGKTRIAAMLASRLDCEILFIVDQLVLLKQAQAEISKHLNRKVGYVGESKFRLERVTIATIQTLHLHRQDPKFLRWFKNVDVIVIDEVHEAMNRSNFDVVQIANPKCVFGLTATLGLKKKPIRLKAYALCGPVLYSYPVQTGMKEGVLSRGLVIQLVYDNSLKNLKGWTQQEAYKKRVVLNGERNHIITQLVKKAVRNGKYVIVVVDRLLHLEEISGRLKDIKHKIVSGTLKGKGISVEKRFRHKDKFESGDIRCLIVNKVFKKGVDIKRVDLIINASSKPSSNDAIQIFGRGVRIHKDKTGLICIDINDFDTRDKERGKKKNWLAKAAKKRVRAYKQAGITVRKIEYNEELSSRIILKKAEKYLQKELSNGKTRVNNTNDFSSRGKTKIKELRL